MDTGHAAGTTDDRPDAFAAARAPGNDADYVLRLYIAGSAPHSESVVRNIRRLCDEYLEGRYDLAIVDIFQQPALARHAQLIAAPTLIKERPLPLRRFIGTLSNLNPILAALSIDQEPHAGIPKP